MKTGYRPLAMLLSSMLAMLLLSACSSGGGGQDEVTPKPKPTLSIYVYAPDKPLPTRGTSIGAFDDENHIDSLKIWVFKQDKDSLVGYLQLSDAQLANLNSSIHGETYRMEVSEQFAETRPNVRVYVMANVTADNCGLVFNETTTAAQLEAACLSGDYFLNQHDMPAKYLPMTGVLRNQTVSGANPVLHISTAQLVRCVSKIRFVFSNKLADDRAEVYVDSVLLSANMMPTQEYLFLESGDNDGLHVGTAYVPAVTKLVEPMTSPIRMSTNPADYRYQTGEDAQEYEDRILDAIHNNYVTTSPLVYLRESSKPLSGTIFYRMGNDPLQRTAQFTMADATFPRNHSWIVYGYYVMDLLELTAVEVTPWTTVDVPEHTIYNW